MKKETIICKQCNKEHVVQNKYSCRSLFCSIQCQQDFRLFERVNEGTAKPKTLKRFLIKENGNKCWTCGITEWNKKSIVMELEHIDGNSANNSLENLSLICPNCHSQTSTYKGKNKGNGRHYRRIRYSEGKSF
jgi:Zn finger protein HypA/HybF involved in hydrogenase expression